MNSQPVVTLKKLIEQHGIELTKDARRTEALLNDLCPSYRTEVFVLVNAQRQQVPDDLLAAPHWMPLDATATRLSRRLQDRLALSEDAAAWAVASWATALKLQQQRMGLAKLVDHAFAFLRNDKAPNSSDPKQHRSGQNDVQSPLPEQATAQIDGAIDKASAQILDSSPRNADRAWPSNAEDSSVNVRLTRFAAVASLLAAIWIVVSVTWPWSVVESALAMVGFAETPGRIVAKHYAIPRIAWVSDGPLNVRQEPDMNADRVAELATGASVRVSDYSPDMQWSHITEPHEGWVSNWYLNFLVDDQTDRTVRLIYQDVVSAQSDATVYAEPAIDAVALAVLDIDTVVTAIAATPDGLWRQVVSPVDGWIEAANLLPAEK